MGDSTGDSCRFPDVVETRFILVLCEVVCDVVCDVVCLTKELCEEEEG